MFKKYDINCYELDLPHQYTKLAYVWFDLKRADKVYVQLEKCSKREERQMPYFRVGKPLERCKFPPLHLHPRHLAKAGAGRREDGKFHGQGHVSVGQTRKTAGTSYPEVSSRFRLFPRVGHGVGQDKKPMESRRTRKKNKLKLYPQYPF